MVSKTEKTRVSIESSGIQELIVFTSFIATVIFFILNSHRFSIEEILLGSIFVLMAAQAIFYAMVGFITSFVTLDEVESDVEFQNSIDKVEASLNELIVQETNKSLSV